MCWALVNILIFAFSLLDWEPVDCHKDPGDTSPAPLPGLAWPAPSGGKARWEGTVSEGLPESPLWAAVVGGCFPCLQESGLRARVASLCPLAPTGASCPFQWCFLSFATQQDPAPQTPSLRTPKTHCVCACEHTLVCPSGIVMPARDTKKKKNRKLEIGSSLSVVC